MKGAMYRGPRRIEVAEVERPAMGDDEVVVKVVNCGICGSDLHGFASDSPQTSFIVGHEVAGEVVEVGSRVSNVKPGDRVCLEPLIRCGTCSHCVCGEYNLCVESKLIGFRRHGGLAEYVVVPAYSCFPLPANVSFEQGATMEPFAVSIHGVRIARVGFGDTVVVLGSGTIGLYCIAAARAAGASKIIATAKYEHQAAAAEDFGATHVVIAGESTANDSIMRFLGGRGADVVVETVGGSAPTVQQAVEVVRKGGRISLIGVYSGPQTFHFNSLLIREISLIGAYCYNFSDIRRDIELAIDLVSTGRVRSDRIITHRFGLSDIQQAFDTALDKSKRSIKVTVEVRR